MGIEELMKNIILYYGEYENEFVKLMVFNFLESIIKIEEYKNLLQIIYSYHKANFKAPCIATIKECIEKARLKDNTYEPYKIKTTNTDKYNYRQEMEGITEEERQRNLELLKSIKIKRI